MLLALVVHLPIFVSSGYANARYSDSFFAPVAKLPLKEIIKFGANCNNPDSAMAYYTIAIK